MCKSKHQRYRTSAELGSRFGAAPLPGYRQASGRAKHAHQRVDTMFPGNYWHSVSQPIVNNKNALILMHIYGDGTVATTWLEYSLCWP